MNFISLSSRSLVLVPPTGLVPQSGFGRVAADPARYSRLLGNMQRLRGRIYSADGAIGPWELTSDGRHVHRMDRRSWHVLSVDSRDRVYGCARYRPFDFAVDFREMSVGQSELASSEFWRPKLERAVRMEMQTAAGRGIGFAEVGGWALAEEMRHTTEALRIALATYSLAEALGGCIGLTTATVRHGSSTVLRKIGGAPLKGEDGYIPRYYDSQYNCDMEILRFDSSAPNPKYISWLDRLSAELSGVEIVSSGTRDRFAVPVPSTEMLTPVHLNQPVLVA